MGLKQILKDDLNRIKYNRTEEGKAERKRKEKEMQMKYEKKVNELGDNMSGLGTKMMKFGFKLTLLITFPLLFTIFLGPLGLIISLVLIALYVISNRK